MSILSTSPTNTRMFDAEIAAALGDVNAAIIIQQLNYWLSKEKVGVIVDGTKFIYNTFRDWVSEQFPWLSVWQFRKAMSLLRQLGIVKVIRHKQRQWNQTNYYSLDCDRLVEYLKSKNATTTEMVELRISTPQDDNNQQFKVRDSDISLYEPKNTYRKKQQSMVVATSFKKKKKELDSTKSERDQVPSSSFPVQENDNKSSNNQNANKNKNVARVDYIINLKWKDQIKDLDSAGIPVNKTLIGLLKTHKPEEVENAIALVKARKRSQYIPNPAGYFTKVLKENWASENPAVKDSEIDTASLFRYWYDLARELGYCSGQEVRNNEQWVCVSGTWEKWSSAVERGYSLDYLKKVAKRNKNQ